MRLIVIIILLITSFACSNSMSTEKSIKKDTNKNSGEIDIEVVELSPESIETFTSREFRLISSDSVFLSSLRKNDEYYKNLFYKYWYSDKDWFVNSLLFCKYEINAYEMLQFTPNEVNKWRSQKKDENFIFWDSIFSTPKQNK